MGYIYKIVNSVNDKIYVGKTTISAEHRWEQHKKCCGKKRNYKSHLYDAMEKYGVDNFSIEEIEECDNSILNKREMYWIKRLDSKRNGYNITIGGDGNNVIDDIDVAEIIKLWEQGLNQKEISQATGRNHKLVKRVLNENGITREIILKRQCEKQKPRVSKVVYAYNLRGELIGKYQSCRDASADLGIHHTTIGHILNGREKQAKGIIFRFTDCEDVEPLEVNPSKREVHQYSLDGEYITSYESTTEAAKANGLSDTHGIRDSCKTCTRQSGGYQWRRYKVEKIEKFNGNSRPGRRKTA